MDDPKKNMVQVSHEVFSFSTAFFLNYNDDVLLVLLFGGHIYICTTTSSPADKKYGSTLPTN